MRATHGRLVVGQGRTGAPKQLGVPVGPVDVSPPPPGLPPATVTGVSAPRCAWPGSTLGTSPSFPPGRVPFFPTTPFLRSSLAPSSNVCRRRLAQGITTSPPDGCGAPPVVGPGAGSAPVVD